LGHFNLGNVHHNEGRFEEALQSFENSARLDRNFVDPLINGGMLCLSQLNQPARGIEMLREALRRNPNHERANAIRQALARISQQNRNPIQ